MMASPIDLRTKGDIPISIGTAIALECLFGINRERETPKGQLDPYMYYDHVSINMCTLMRNIISSMKPEDIQNTTERRFRETLVNEMNIIEQACLEHGNGRITCSFYYNSYKHLKKFLKDANLKTKFTTKQLIQHELENRIPLQINPREFPYDFTNLEITRGKRKNLLLTHYPVDLLLFKNDVCDLLESHTGRIKKKNEFNSKLKFANDETPFNKYTIQIFGDKSGQIVPMDSKTRAAVLEFFKKSNMSKLIDDKRFIKAMKESGIPEIRSIINKLV